MLARGRTPDQHSTSRMPATVAPSHQAKAHFASHYDCTVTIGTGTSVYIGLALSTIYPVEGSVSAP